MMCSNLAINKMGWRVIYALKQSKEDGNITDCSKIVMRTCITIEGATPAPEQLHGQRLKNPSVSV